MWLFTTFGFFSIVEKPWDRKSKTLTVRARVRSDLEALSDRYLSGTTRIIESPDADYPFRMQVPRSEVIKSWQIIIGDLKYENFKNAAGKRQGPAREKIYHGVADELRGGLRRVQAVEDAELGRSQRRPALGRPATPETVAGKQFGQGAGEPSDRKLVDMHRDSPGRLVKLLYKRHRPALLRYLRGRFRSCQSIADDGVQIVFKKLLARPQALTNWRGQDSIVPYLTKMAFRETLLLVRMMTRSPVETTPVQLPRPDDFDTIHDWGRLCARMREGLTDRSFEVWWRRQMFDETNQGIAKSLGLTAGNVAVIYSRACDVQRRIAGALGYPGVE